MTPRFVPLSLCVAGALLLLGGCGEEGGNLNEPPGPPEISLSPVEPVTTDALEVQITTDSVDPNGDLAGYHIAWLLNREARPDLDSATTILSSQTHRDEIWTAVVTPYDALDTGGESTSAEVTIRNSPPQVQVSFSHAAPSTLDDLTAVILASDPDEDPIQTTISWTRNGDPQPDYNDQTALDSEETSRGETWRVTVSPHDGTASGELASATVQVVNSAPLIVEARIEPNEGTEETVLTASASASDPDGDPITMSYSWYVNEVELDGQTFSALSPDYFDKGDEVWALVVPFDGQSPGGSAATTHVTIANSPPSVTGASLSPEQGGTDTEFSCIVEGWSDPDPVDDAPAYHYQWRVNGTSVGSSSTLTPTAFDHFDELYCRSRPTDGEDNGEWVNSDTIVIGNGPPSMDDPVVSLQGGESEAVESSVFQVTTSGFTDPDSDPEGYVYQWFTDGVAVAGGTGSTLDGGSFDKGEVVTVTVSPWDGYQSGTAWTSGNWPVLNSIPSVVSVTLSPAAPTTDQDVTATASGWEDGDGDSEGYAVLWDISGDDPEVSSLSLSSDLFVRGDEITVTITPDDGEGQGTSVSSGDPIVVANTPPPTPVISLLPALPQLSEALSCTVDTTATASDADGDTVTYSYLWYEDEAATANTASTLPGSEIASGADWTCEVTPNDSYDPGSPASATVSVDGCTALSLESNPGVATLPASTAFAYGDQHTIEAWIRWDGSGDEWQHIYSSGSFGFDSLALGIFGGVDGATCTGRSAGQLYLRVGPNTCWRTTTAVTSGQWHHVAGVYDNGSVRLFIDGVEETTDTTTAAVADASAAGAQISHSDTDYDFSGVVDELRLSSSARYSAGFTPETFVATDAATQGLWHANDVAGGVLWDSSGNSLNGVLTGGATSTNSSCDIEEEAWALDYNCTAASSSSASYYFCNILVFPENLVDQCGEIGWLPVTIADADENAYLVTTACGIDSCPDSTGSDQHHWYIGLSDANTEGTWEWLSGDAVTYTNFHSGEPNGGTNSNYTTLLRFGGGGGWNDDSGPKIGFVCEAP